MLQEKIEMFLLESEEIDIRWVDTATEAIKNNFTFVKRVALDLEEANIRGRGNIYNMAMKMARQNRISYEESELISAILASRHKDFVEAFNNGTF